MRVISGKVRGLKLDSPSGTETRPTLDRVKEAVFSMLLPYIPGAKVLDLFAGSGALGIEALSRGAETAMLIDCDENAIDCINRNLSSAKFVENTTVLRTSAEFFLQKTDKKFDLIFLDPPYAKDLYSDILGQISKYKVLADDGLIVVEWDNTIGFTDDLAEFCVFKEKKYGRVGITVLKWS